MAENKDKQATAKVSTLPTKDAAGAPSSPQATQAAIQDPVTKDKLKEGTQKPSAEKVAKATVTKTAKKTAVKAKKAQKKKQSAAKKPAGLRNKPVTDKKPVKAGTSYIQKTEKIMTQGTVQFEKITKDAANNGKESMEAFIKSGNIFMKGFEDIAKAYMGLAQTSVEKNTQAVQSLLSCKTITEFTDLHNKWTQQNFDDFMSGTTRLSELTVKVTTDALEPINDQLGKSIKKAGQSLAA